jgi:hypothetical protein
LGITYAFTQPTQNGNMLSQPLIGFYTEGIEELIDDNDAMTTACLYRQWTGRQQWFRQSPGPAITSVSLDAPSDRI